MRTPTLAALPALLMLATPGLAADPVLPDFDPAAFAEPRPNPFVPLEIGHTHVISGTRASGLPAEERAVITVAGPGPVILGVPTVTIIDEAFEDGILVERTFDYYANDREGNLWYFGEDVTNFRYDDAGRLTGTDSESQWRAGVNGAQPGISVPAVPVIGLTHFQEHAPADEAMDFAEIVAVDLELTGPAGTYTGVFQAFETSAMDPTLGEFKFYAPGAGMIRAEEELSPARDNPEIVIEMQP